MYSSTVRSSSLILETAVSASPLLYPSERRALTASLLRFPVIVTSDDINLSSTDIESKKTALTQPLESMLYGRDFSTQTNGLSAPQLLLNGKTGIAYNYLLALDHFKPTLQKPTKKLKGPKRLLKAYESFKEEIKDKCDELVVEKNIQKIMIFIQT